MSREDSGTDKTLNVLAIHYQALKNYAQAVRHAQAACSLTQEIPLEDGGALYWSNLGEVAAWHTDFRLGITASIRSIEIALAYDLPIRVSWGMNSLGRCCFFAGQVREATQLWTIAEGIREFRKLGPDAKIIEALEECRRILGDVNYYREVEQAQSYSDAEQLAYAFSFHPLKALSV